MSLGAAGLPSLSGLPNPGEGAPACCARRGPRDPPHMQPLTPRVRWHERSNRKTGFKCPRGCGKKTAFDQACPGKCEKSHPILPRSEVAKRRKKAPPPPPAPPAAKPKPVAKAAEPKPADAAAKATVAAKPVQPAGAKPAAASPPLKAAAPAAPPVKCVPVPLWDRRRQQPLTRSAPTTPPGRLSRPPSCRARRWSQRLPLPGVSWVWVRATPPVLASHRAHNVRSPNRWRLQRGVHARRQWLGEQGISGGDQPGWGRPLRLLCRRGLRRRGPPGAGAVPGAVHAGLLPAAGGGGGPSRCAAWAGVHGLGQRVGDVTTCAHTSAVTDAGGGASHRG